MSNVVLDRISRASREAQSTTWNQSQYNTADLYTQVKQLCMEIDDITYAMILPSDDSTEERLRILIDELQRIRDTILHDPHRDD